ncbi:MULTISPECIES: VanZ family protein [unclassified Nocardioides]|uniref:VanZ family protein n=1 Tax=unclassified Nocardioides TaxID=2615069 RepID=UPI0009EB7F86|nr:MULTISPECIES: VanZ family protein [unclassified Nocardioides]
MRVHGVHDILGTATGIAVGALALLPLALLGVWALARLRIRTGALPGRAWRTSIAEVGLVHGTVPWVWMTMLPGNQAGLVTGAVSLEPFRDLETMSEIQVVGNLVLLSALGFFAPLRFRSLASLPRIVVLAACCSALIETAQYTLRLDRVSSVDDVLLNTAGAAVAAVLSWPWWDIAPRAEPIAVNHPIRGTAGATASTPRRAP